MQTSSILVYVLCSNKKCFLNKMDQRMGWVRLDVLVLDKHSFDSSSILDSVVCYCRICFLGEMNLRTDWLRRDILAID